MPRPSTPGRAAQFARRCQEWAPLWSSLVGASLVLVAGTPSARDLVGGVARDAHASYRVLGTSPGSGSTSATPTWRSTAARAAVEVRRIDGFAFGAPSARGPPVEDGTLSITSRCPDRCSAPAARLPAHGARQRAAERADVERLGARHRRARLGAHQHRLGRDLRDRLLRLPAARELGLRRRQRGSASARPTGVELRSRSGDVRAVVPSGRYQIDAQSDSGSAASAGSTTPTTRRSRCRRSAPAATSRGGRR